VFCTTSGQSFSLSVKDQNESSIKASEENMKEKKINYQSSIDRLTKELQSEQEVLTGYGLEDRTYLNKNGVQPTNEKIAQIKDDIKYYENLRDSVIDSMGTSETIEVKSMNTYILISEEFPILSPRWLKLYAQVTLSFLISLMAPAGILMLSALRNIPVKPEIEPIKPVISDNTDEISELNPVIEGIKPEIKESEPEIIPEIIPEPVNQLSRIAASNITMMLLRGNKFLMRPEVAYEKFKEVPDRDAKKLIYSTEECKIMYDFIIENKLENESKEKIMERWNNG